MRQTESRIARERRRVNHAAHGRERQDHRDAGGLRPDSRRRRGGCDEGDGCAERNGGHRGGNLELCVFFLAFVMSSGVETSLEPRF